MSKKIVFIVGSLREKSFNKELSVFAADALKAKGAEVSYLDYADVPLFDQDDEYPTPAAVARVREEVNGADAIWIFSPEYNYSYPGVLKNLLDWLSRPLKEYDFGGPTALSGKTVALASIAGKSKGAGVRAKLAEIFSFEFTHNTLVDGQGTGAELAPEAFTTGVNTFSEETKQELAKQADDLLAAIAD
ncbi:NADPH-dependent FMN reductase [Bifidobacterium vespertilionis]|uniref:NAD(P)H-dependent oxidoreductase n=1 Tax=Bifidobacterium vespertilionis TaxID=2562524 RepID=A0A5J5E4Y9_9BIFI|nr:NADPH-dependent FMN reductase [Bifidobacterium vespertilionis]KAA8822663.1 NAD(P)H-dependent oxidoreductase [Bifidobacterium vespertilionis]KAA8824052.1 NAD(P)H-dependent oxidoreductase [Bifidobacterium vespertilionis]MBT1179161.1 NAD(P)H-dependent oxidoreductase [Bifidobacterium vespertilionis]